MDVYLHTPYTFMAIFLMEKRKHCRITLMTKRGVNFYVCSSTGRWWGSLRERGHWGDQDVDGRIILKWIFRKLEGVVGTGWSWLMVGTGGGHLWVR